MTVTAQRFRLLPLVLALLVGSTTVAGTANAATTVVVAANTPQDAFDQQMLELMNGARASAGAPALTANAGLRNLALSWSNHMANGGTGNVLQHNPNVRGLLPSYGAASATGWAENIANWSPGNGRDAASVFNLYMNSPGHRANILNPAMRFVGVGTVVSGSNVGWNTQKFTDRVDQSNSPIGTFDAATTSGTRVAVSGWALEPSNRGLSIQVHIYINNSFASGLATSVDRPDVNGAYGATGTHGFAAELSMPIGTNTVCAYAISSIGAGNTGIGCRTVVRTAPDPIPPIGVLDSAAGSGSSVAVRGWALEPTNKALSIGVHFYINNGFAGGVGTSVTRPDVNAAYGATGAHGFAADLPLQIGSNSVCAYAISSTGAGNTALGCRTVVRSSAPAPVGYLDSIAIAGTNVRVRGWAFDPAASGSSSLINVIVDGNVTRAPTNGSRPDVNAALGITGNHGFDRSLPIGRGSHHVCVDALSLTGGPPTRLGCATVSR